MKNRLQPLVNPDQLQRLKPITTYMILLMASLSSPIFAQQSYALKPYAITLPRLTTAQQSTSAPQQAGNLVYNTDQQKLAVHNGTTWQYLAPAEAGQFQNAKRFVAGDSQFWTVPTGVTRMMAEVWGGGAAGPVYAYNNSNELVANGGGAGGYARGFITVTPGETLTLTVGSGGRGASRISNRLPGNGENTTIKSAALAPTGGSLLGAGGGLFDVGYGGIGGSSFGSFVGFAMPGSNGSPATISYGQRSASDYILLIQCGNGGTAYGAQPGGFGTQISSTNSAALLYTSGDGKTSQDGGYPGGGGGCGYNYGGYGASGMIVLYW